MGSPLICVELSISKKRKGVFDSRELGTSGTTQGLDGSEQVSWGISQDLDEGQCKAKKYLYVFFLAPKLVYCSIPVDSLLSMTGGALSGEIEPPRIKDYRADYMVTYCRSCVCCKDSVYLIGGIERSCQWNVHFSRQVLSFDIAPPYLIENPSSSKKSQMNSGKGLASLALEYRGILYILGERSSREVMDCFECYNPETDVWDVLEPPPFCHKNYEYCTPRPIVAYVVMDGKICVSDDSHAYAYDIALKKWENCYLFDEYEKCYTEFSFLCPFCGRFDPGDDEEIWCTYYNISPDKICRDETYKDQNDDEETPAIDDETSVDKSSIDETKDSNLFLRGGESFEFRGEAILYEDKYLMALLRASGLVLAYEIQGGRVVGVQELFKVPMNASVHSLVALDQNKFCVAYSEFDGRRWLILKIFKVSISKEGSKERLESGIYNTFSVDFSGYGYNHSWECFAV